MCNLVHTHTKSKIAYALNFATHTFSISPQYQACSKQERDVIIHVILKKKKKKKNKIKYFCLF